MKPQDTYYVREFAKLAGVTVRTLHYYDEAGLLKPLQHTAANHRLYRREDLLRLQQILTLKHMGFSLDDIRDILNDSAFDIRRSLETQKEAVDAQVATLQRVSRALDYTLALVSRLDYDNLDWNRVIEVIRGVTMTNQYEQWAGKYYNEEQKAYIQERAKQFTQADFAQGQLDWEKVYDGFRALRAQNAPADHPEAQRLAGEMDRLVSLFTGGNESIRESLKAMWSNPQDMPDDVRKQWYDPELEAYMNEAVRIYQERKQA